MAIKHLLCSYSSVSISTCIRSRLCSIAAAETRSQKLERIADELLSLTRLERYDYSILFNLKLGLHRFAPTVTTISSSSSASGSQPSPAAVVPEKTSFDLKLEKFEAAAKIKVIKEVRTFTNLGLKEAKELVEKAPVVLKKGITKEEGDPILLKLKDLGAIVVLE